MIPLEQVALGGFPVWNPSQETIPEMQFASNHAEGGADLDLGR
jgi:hypothetical protein